MEGGSQASTAAARPAPGLRAFTVLRESMNAKVARRWEDTYDGTQLEESKVLTPYSLPWSAFLAVSGSAGAPRAP